MAAEGLTERAATVTAVSGRCRHARLTGCSADFIPTKASVVAHIRIVAVRGCERFAAVSERTSSPPRVASAASGDRGGPGE